MVHLPSILSLGIITASLVVARPTTDITLQERATCTFSGKTGAADVAKNKKSCSTITLSNVEVPAGTTLDLTGLNDGTKVIFQGTTTFGYKEWVGPLVSVSGTSITVTGDKGAVLDGNGARWWDTLGGNGGKMKPKFFYAHKMQHSSINGLYFKDSPVQLMSINGCTNLAINGVTMNNANGAAKGHNTDAFDVGSSDGVVISGANVINQDDCLAINSGTNITFTGGSCTGGHGLSIGSVGGRSNNIVKGVKILSSKIINSENGVRIKTVSGATGSVSDITYRDITLTNIAKYGIVIEQDYLNGGPTGKPTTGVPISKVTVDNVHGTVASKGTNIYLLCGKGSCSNWTWNKVSVTGGKKSSACQNVPAGASC